MRGGSPSCITVAVTEVPEMVPSTPTKSPTEISVIEAVEVAGPLNIFALDASTLKVVEAVLDALLPITVSREPSTADTLPKTAGRCMAWSPSCQGVEVAESPQCGGVELAIGGCPPINP
jgi:hypothetical protein